MLGALGGAGCIWIVLANAVVVFQCAAMRSSCHALICSHPPPPSTPFTGCGLLHHPRRRAAAPHPADSRACDRHRQPRRLHPRQAVPPGAQGELCLRALGRHPGHLRSVRHQPVHWRRPQAGLHRRWGCCWHSSAGCLLCTCNGMRCAVCRLLQGLGLSACQQGLLWKRLLYACLRAGVN
jgi:hypothetical protein